MKYIRKISESIGESEERKETNMSLSSYYGGLSLIWKGNHFYLCLPSHSSEEYLEIDEDLYDKLYALRSKKVLKEI